MYSVEDVECDDDEGKGLGDGLFGGVELGFGGAGNTEECGGGGGGGGCGGAGGYSIVI